jgi:hypothetical protein
VVSIAYPEVKSNRTGCASTFALGPVVGWKYRRTGAVWSINCETISASTFQNHASDPTYRLEGVLSVHKVQRAKQQPTLRFLVALDPAFGQQIPLGLEFTAEYASESCLKSGKQHCDRVVSWSLGQLGVACIVELQRSYGELLAAEVAESVVRGRLFGGESREGQQRGGEEL